MTLMDLIRRLEESPIPVKLEITVEDEPVRAVRFTAVAGGVQAKRGILLNQFANEPNQDAYLDWLVAQMTKTAVDNALSAETAS